MTMRRLVTTTVMVLMLGVGTGTAQAQIIRFTAALSGADETPGVLTGAFGNASVTLDVGAQRLTWSIDVFNLPSGISNAHFHVGGPGIAGPTVVNIPFTANQSNDFNLSGTATAENLLIRNDQGIRSWEDFMQALQGGQIYINIHTAVNGAGEIRGQVVRAQ
jgi:hypothetical protein